ncbi:MAG: ribosomal protein S18-alanine N-acetyltransferase [Pseudomonadota bacterium]
MTSIIEATAENGHIYLDHLLEIENLCFSSPWSPKLFQDEFRSLFSHLWILMVDQIPLGYICFWMYEREIQLFNIAVHPLKQGKGLGNYLLTKMIEAGSTNGVHSIWLEVRPSNSAARKLYQNLGFKEIGRRPRYYEDTGEDAVMMSLPLSQNKSYHMASN